MKLKALALSIALAAGVFAANAQTAYKGNDTFIGIGGGITALGAVAAKLHQFSADGVHGTVLTRDEIESQLKTYAAMTALERDEKTCLPPGRADIIIGGACIVISALELVGARTLKVSARGLRHAIVRSLLDMTI